MRLAAQDYEPLKAFFEWMWNRLLPNPDGLPPEAWPPAVLAGLESHSMSMARQGLGEVIGDIVEMTDRLSADEVRSFDAALAAEGLLTLSAVRARFARTIRGIMKRGAIRSENEYHALRNVVDSMPEDEREKGWRLLGDYELRIAPAREG
jgi:hypothetical protein